MSDTYRAEYSRPHPVIGYVKGQSLIVADLGDRGNIQEAKWQLEVWVEKIVSEMGYKLLMGALVDPEAKPTLTSYFQTLGSLMGLKVVWENNWRG